MKDEDRFAHMTREFERIFGRRPVVWSRAPGRVDLMGSHTDYNLGYVMTMTVDRDTWLAARPREDKIVTVYSLDVPGGGQFELDDIGHDRAAPWTNYVRGVALALSEAGYPLRGFDGLVHSTVPLSSGLSSSAALEMATAILFREISGFTIEPLEMALLGQKAENQFVGVNSGILDQYSSVMGRAGSAILLDCRDLTHSVWPIVAGLQAVICDTRAQRQLTGSEYDDRRAQCEEGVRLLRRVYPDIVALRDVNLEQFEDYETELPPVVARRCRFIIEENRRVLDLAQALESGDVSGLANLMAESYRGARDLYEIGAPAMAAMMSAMQSAPGVIGARQAGAGFGGCMVALVEETQVEVFVQHVERQYRADTGTQPDVYPTRPAAGAGLVVA
jgi:galactokinase